MSKWGYSQLNLYKDCPLRFKWERVDKRPPTVTMVHDDRNAYIGNVLGKVVERFYMERWWREPVVLHARMIAAIKQAGDDCHTRGDVLPWAPGEREKWDQIAREAIPVILQTVATDRLLGVQVGCEYDIAVPLGGDTVFGRIDLWLITPDNQLTVLDEKGGGSLGRHVSTDQLRMYALGMLADPRFRRLPDRIGFWWLRHGKIIWKRFSRETLQTFVGGVKRTIASIRAEQFEPKPSSRCRFCDYLTGCGAGQSHLWSNIKSRGVPTTANNGRLDLNASDG